MGFRCGIVGLPNVGKSTLFNALTDAGIAAENYPFCTIDPNVGMVAVPDPRLLQLKAIAKPQNLIPTTMEFVDIAGLVKDAAKGEGLGNKFLANIRETDAIAHVVRCFEDDNVVHVAGQVDPIADIEVINTELLLADMETVEKSLAKAQKTARTGQKAALGEAQLLERLKEHLDAGQSARSFEFDSEDAPLIRDLHLLTAKPVMYIANVDDTGFSNNPLLDTVEDYARKDNAPVVPVCAALEAEILALGADERDEFLKELDLEEPGLNRVIRAGYELLGLQTYFTAGPKEVRAWTIPKAATAPQAAGKIHTDFEKGFIRAEVISFNDYTRCKGEAGAKEAGKLRSEGKDYIVQDGDVIHFLFNV